VLLCALQVLRSQWDLGTSAVTQKQVDEAVMYKLDHDVASSTQRFSAAFEPVRLRLESTAALRASVTGGHVLNAAAAGAKLHALVQEYDLALAALDDQLPAMQELAADATGQALPAALSMLLSARAAEEYVAEKAQHVAELGAGHAERIDRLITVRATLVAERASAAAAAAQVAAKEQAALRKQKRKQKRKQTL
jgi:hypothetical protein